MPTFTDINTLRDRLASVEAAIEAARTAASYSIGGRTLARQELANLQSERTRLMRDIKRTQAALEGVRSPGAAVATWT